MRNLKKRKMKNKKIQNIIMILSFGLLLLFAGCSGGADGAKSDGIFSIGKGSSSGTNSGSSGGVTLEFAEQNPPSEMIKDQPYTFAFIFKNYQEHEISDLVVKTKGFERGYVESLGESYNIGTLPPATITSGPGVYTGQIVQGVKVGGFEGNFQFNPEFDYCYSAKTKFIEQICVPSKLNQCDTQVEKFSKQNGLLKVSIDRISSLEDKIRIDFVITSSGSGKVVNECFKLDDYSNAYSLGDVKLGSEVGQCDTVSGENIIGGKSNFYCEFSRSGDSSYASQVSVDLSYRYQDTYKKSIKVIDLNQGYN